MNTWMLCGSHRQTQTSPPPARRIQRTLYEDPPGIFLVNLTTARAVSRRFAVPSPVERDVAQTVWQWQPTPIAR